MSRTSRIPHPPGSRFVAVYHWAVKKWGFAEAAVLGLLDFFDRAQANEGQPLASRQRIVAELEGIVGRDSVDRALRTLVETGALKVYKTTTACERNLQTRIDYCIDIEVVSRILQTPGATESRSSGENGRQEFRQQRKAGLEPGLKAGPSSKCSLDINAAAARTSAQQLANAAAHSTTYKPVKIRSMRASGIVTWCDTDIVAAERVEEKYDAAEVTAATSAVAATGKDPVPGLVSREIERQHRDHEAAHRRSAVEAAHKIRLASQPNIDEATLQRGDEFIARIKRNRTNHQDL